jgi:hypothetical protein
VYIAGIPQASVTIFVYPYCHYAPRKTFLAEEYLGFSHKGYQHNRKQKESFICKSESIHRSSNIDKFIIDVAII